MGMSARFAAKDAHLLLRFDYLNRVLAAQKIDERCGIRRRVDAAYLETSQFTVIDGQGAPVLEIELLSHIAEWRFFEYQTFLHPGRGNRRVGAGWLGHDVRQDRELFTRG